MDSRPIVEIEIRIFPEYAQLYSFISSGCKNTIFHVSVYHHEFRTVEVLMLTSCMVKMIQRGCGFRLFVDEKTSELLEAIGHKDLVESGQLKVDSGVYLSQNKSTVIGKLNSENMLSYVMRIQQFAKIVCPGKDLEIFDLCISELVNNVLNHSESEEGAYVLCRYIEQGRTISLAVCDLGIGIPTSVNRFLNAANKSEISSIDCLKWALKENNTTRSTPQNMGKGLDNVNSFIRSVRSKWSIMSGAAQLIGLPSGNRYYLNAIDGFIGTSISINIRIDNLNDAQSDYSEGW